MAIYSVPKTWNVGDVLTAADMNNYVRDNILAIAPVGKYGLFAAASAGAAVENLINGAWLECNGASVLRATYPSWDAYVASLTPTRPFGAVDGTHVSVPDFYGGRVPLHLGSAAAVSTLGNSDGVAAANRRGQLHKSTVADPGHAHLLKQETAGGGGNHWINSFGASSSTFADQASMENATTGITVGPGVSTDPADAGAYQVAGIWAVKVV